MQHAQAVADNVRTLMYIRRVTQREVGQRLGIGQPAVSSRLTGRVALDVNELCAIADLLDVHPATLLGTPQTPGEAYAGPASPHFPAA